MRRSLLCTSSLLLLSQPARHADAQGQGGVFPLSAGPSSQVFDAVVIGSGVVGLAVAREVAHKYGASVVVVEKEDNVVAG